MCGRVYGKIRYRGSQVVELVVTPTHAVSYYSLFLILLCQRNFQSWGNIIVYFSELQMSEVIVYFKIMFLMEVQRDQGT